MRILWVSGSVLRRMKVEVDDGDFANVECDLVEDEMRMMVGDEYMVIDGGKMVEK